MLSAEDSKNLEQIAKDAALYAVNQCTSTSGTFVSTYRSPVSQMIESALFSALKAFKLQADAREKILLDKIDMLSKKANTNLEINGTKFEPTETLSEDLLLESMQATIPDQNKINRTSNQKTKPQVSWADRVKENKKEFMDEIVPDFEVVQSRKKKTEKITKKIIGKMEQKDTLIKASKEFIKKKVCYLGNISPCSVDTIKEHLSKINVNFITCYPVFKKTKSSGNSNTNLEPNDENVKTDSMDKARNKDEAFSPTDMSSSFRLCITSEATTNMFNPDNWPRYVVVREWTFKQNNKQ